MKRTVSFAAVLLLVSASAIHAQTKVNGRQSLVLDGQAATVVLDLAGGSISDFHMQDQGLNPLQWDSWCFSPNPAAPPTPDPRSMGHFLCLDRWGPASAAETAHGMQPHGEASRVLWTVTQAATTQDGSITAAMAATLPLAGMSVKRHVRLATDSALLTVREEVTNDNKLGRIYNIVQHPTIGPPFLDVTTLVDSNARQGLTQNRPVPRPEEPAVYWPQALKQDGQALLLGYFWPTADYPWFSAWRHVEDGQPFARGLEFGTTGLHQPFPVLVEKLSIFDRSLFAYLDAGQTVVKSYAAFLLKIPEDFRGVDRIEYADGELTLYERGGPTRLSLEVGQLFY